MKRRIEFIHRRLGRFLLTAALIQPALLVGAGFVAIDAVRAAPSVSTMAAGANHTLVVKSDGTLWAFGDNYRGQLGNTTNLGNHNPNPTPMQVMSGVTAVAAGESHSLALKSDGTLWAFGDNSGGQLGVTTIPGTPPVNPTPTLVMSSVKSVAAGDGHSLALKLDGTLWTFGSNNYGQLGNGSSNYTANPTPTQVLSDVIDIAAGGSHNLAVKSDGTLWTFGENAFGQLGTATNSGDFLANPTPTQVMSGVATVAAGGIHSVVLKTDGTVWTFGSNGSGQLGNNTIHTDPFTYSVNPAPTQVMSGVTTVAAGGAHSLAVKSDGTLWAFGDNSSGQLGTTTNVGTSAPTPTSPPMPTPTPTPTQVMSSVIAVAAGGAHSLVVKSDGMHWAFGSNYYGQLGTTTNSGVFIPNPTPTKVLFASAPATMAAPMAVAGNISAVVSFVAPTSDLPITGYTVRSSPGGFTSSGFASPLTVVGLSNGSPYTFTVMASSASGNSNVSPASNSVTPVPILTVPVPMTARIAAGKYHSLALKSDGTLWSFGRNDYGEMDTPFLFGTSYANPAPTQVMSGVTAVAAGGTHSLALKSDGTLWTFGYNGFGQLGNTSGTFNLTPTQVMSGVIAVAGGASHTMALKSDGTLWTFGINFSGQLGIATNIFTGAPNPTPTQVMSGVTAIAAGDEHSLALKSDGTLWTFGSNFYGQLGHNGGSSSPTQVMSGVSAVAAGRGHSLVLKLDGSLWTFGHNESGQLGNTTNNYSANANPTPTQVMSGVTAVAAGFFHSLALKSDGTLWTFGSNGRGQLGTATNFRSGNPNPAPVQVMSGVVAIAAGEVHSLALKSDGTVWAFGGNNFGQLGANTGVDNSTPTQVLFGAPPATMAVPSAVAGNGSAVVSFAAPASDLAITGYTVTASPGGITSSGTSSPIVVAGLSNGTAYTFTVVATSAAGNSNPSPPSIAVTPVVPGVPPTVPATMAAPVATARVGGSVSVAFAIPDNGGSPIFGYIVIASPGGSTVIGGGSPLGFSGLASGTAYTFTVTATNAVGMSLASAPSAAVTADGTAPTAPVVNPTNGTSVSGTGEVGATVKVTNSLGTLLCSITVPPSGSFTCPLSPTAPDGAVLTVTLTDVVGNVSAGTNVTTQVVVPPVGQPAVPLASLVPGRVLESRPGFTTVDGQFQGDGARAAGSVTELQITGRHGVPADAIAVVLNVTVTGAQGGGFVTVWPCGEPMPNASSLNYTAGSTVANAVITKIGAGGKVCLLTAGSGTNLLVDLNGFNPIGSSFVSLVPGRVLESRPGYTTVDGQFQGMGVRAAGSVTELQITGRHGVPADAAAVVLNVTVTGAQGEGYVTVWPCDQPMPNASSLNYTAGSTVANAVITKIGAGGKVCLFTAGSGTDLLADVNGFYPAGSSFVSLVPGRVLESRPGFTTVDAQFQGVGLRGAGSVTELQISGRHGVPADASAVVLNVTVTGAQGGGFVTVWPCGEQMPNASSLNYTFGSTVANAVITKIGAGGKVCLFTAGSGTHLLADINGYQPA